MHEHVLVGRITGLQIFTVPEFGTRVSFKIECAERRRAACCIAGDIAREFIANYREGDMIAIRGAYEPAPSTASSRTSWAGRFHVCALHTLQLTGIAR
jgi:hypothetical protein